jgi:hypothetical protein
MLLLHLFRPGPQGVLRRGRLVESQRFRRNHRPCGTDFKASRNGTLILLVLCPARSRFRGTYRLLQPTNYLDLTISVLTIRHSSGKNSARNMESLPTGPSRTGQSKAPPPSPLSPQTRWHTCIHHHQPTTSPRPVEPFPRTLEPEEALIRMARWIGRMGSFIRLTMIIMCRERF